MEENIARCIGLWLAEGDNKTHFEVTFTNNYFELVDFFFENVKQIYQGKKIKLLIYKPSKNCDFEVIDGAELSEHTDERASKPYYLLRFKGPDFCNKWKKLVKVYKGESSYFKYILQGFFAGEGSVYQGKKKSRRIRISQGKRNDFLEAMLDHFHLEYRFRKRGRSYVITKKSNWDKLNKIEIAKLHPRKKKKFKSIYEGFKEEHYRKGKLRSMVLEEVINPYTTRELAEKFNRSKARVCKVLTQLKKDGLVKNYKAGGPTYWIREDQNAIIISKVKKNYIDLLNNRKLKVGKISEYFSVNKSSAYKNLKRLKELGLIEKKNHKWKTLETEKEVIVL